MFGYFGEGGRRVITFDNDFVKWGEGDLRVLLNVISANDVRLVGRRPTRWFVGRHGREVLQRSARAVVKTGRWRGCVDGVGLLR